ncbi:DUF2169 family type VI secretion system accessory protein [Polyangium spumosum]|uniref:DUF2169 domain-containing protein n=1 Tax=Polyangium spumosum TaxID=889282 RepID=A0A6N7PU15_9BACT|nr:DUF2169 domain-containing protein [Polyangium spumosum]MRG94286.1 DUF2169 domain-containing protein [Polyangium spumosum]
MKTLKPLRLGVLTRPFENERRYYLSIAVMAFFPFDQPERLLPEISMWKLVADELGQEGILDECMPKSTAELLLGARAFPPNGPKPSCHVRLQMESVDRTLYVFGDRRWTLAGVTDPQPFSGLPITWSRAFGGEGFAKNPIGKGAKPVRADDVEVHELPNVENPKQLVRSPRDRPDPAGFSPLDISWPQRTSKAGTYDDRWLKERYPGYPADFDWTFFNVAPEGQRFADFLRGGEEFVLENMHPREATLRGRLPTGVARCFVEVEAEGGTELRDVPTRIDTVWLFPHHARGVVIHRGVVPVAEDDAADVINLLAAYEAPGKSKPVAHYKKAMAERLDPRTATFAVLRDRDLLPEMPERGAHPDEEVSDMNELLASERLVLENARRGAQKRIDESREAIEKNFAAHPELAGHPPDTSGIPKELPPMAKATHDLEELPDVVENALKEAEAAKKKAEAEAKEMEERARALCKEQNLDYDKLVADAKEKDRKAKRRFSAKAQLEHLEELVKLADNADFDASEIRAALADPKLVETLVALEEQLNEAYRRFAHHLAPTEAEGDGILAAELERGARAGETFAGRDFTNADLRGLDLRGVDFEGAFLEGARLVGTNLTGANLKKAVLARADLSEAKLEGADLSDANAGGVVLKDADLTGARLTRTVLAKADLTGARLPGANLDGTDLGEARLVGTNLERARASNLMLLRATLEDVNLRGADLTKTIFVEGSMRNVDLSGATCAGTVFLSTSGEGTRFDRAEMRSARFVKEASFPRSSFVGARMEGANLRGANLEGADFSDADLTSADLSEAKLEGARLARIHANDALFVRADLRRANLEQAVMMQAILQKARVDGTNFQEANLFRADFLRMRGDKHTSLKGAFVKRVRSVPERGENG